MTRRWKYLFLALGAAALLLAGWFAHLLLGTTEGARMAMTAVSRLTPYDISARRVQGSLWGGLKLEEARLAWRAGELRSGRLLLAWRPLAILTGTVSVQELILTDMRVRDNRPLKKGAPELVWPTVTGLPAHFDMRIAKLRIDTLQYRRLSEPPVVASGIATSVQWRDGKLTLRDLTASTPAGRLEGSVTAGFRNPSLYLKLVAIPARPRAGIDRANCTLALLPARRPELMAGKADVSLFSGGKVLLALSGELAAARDAVRARRLTISQPGRGSVATGDGSLRFAADGTRYGLRLAFADLDLYREIRQRTALSGRITLTGKKGDYRGEFSIVNRVAGWRSGHLSGSLRGDAGGMEVTALDGTVLDGRITGSLGADWREGLALRGALSGRRLNPVLITPDWKGVVNLDIKGSADWSGGALARAEVSGRLLDSRLRGRELTGNVDAALAQGNLKIGRLDLHGRGFDIHGAGELRRRLAFTARISDLSGLVPGGGGALVATGWGRWQNGRASGSVSATGRGLAMGGVRMGSADLSARVGEGAGYPVDVAVTGRNVFFRQWRLDALELRASGNEGHHTIQTSGRAPGFSLQATLAGGYRDGVWRGQIVQLAGRDGVGPWRMRAPVALVAAPGALEFSRLVLDGASGESLEGEGRLTFRPLLGRLSVRWQGLNLARLSPWAGDFRPAGSSSGNVLLRLPGGERLLLAGEAVGAGSVFLQGGKVTVREAHASADWNERGTLTLFDLKTADGGVLKGSLSSSGPARPALPASGEIAAECRGIDLSLVRSFFPKGVEVKGSVTGKAAGRLMPGMRLALRGNAALSRGKALWQEGKDRIDAGLRTAEVSWGWQGSREGKIWRTSLLTLDGRLDATGSALLDNRSFTVEESSLRLVWSDKAMRSTLALKLAGGGEVHGSFLSPFPFAGVVPRQGTIDADWLGFDLTLLHPWLPAGLNVEGTVGGEARGQLLPGNRLDIQGKSAVSGGAVRWSHQGGNYGAAVKEADISWKWRGDALSGSAVVVLAEYGEARADFRFPLPARFPVAVNQKGPLKVAVTGRAMEMGLLSSLFPGVIQESRGELDLDASIGGQWRSPDLSGSIKLVKAGAYLPSAGIELKDAELSARLARDQLIVDSFAMSSGGGRIGGNGMVRLKDWRPVSYRGKIAGESFRIVHLPELEAVASPNLTFDGSPERLAVRGQVAVPELTVNAEVTRPPVQPSSDVVVEGEAKAEEKTARFPLDLKVDLILGDKVRIRGGGIDARLAGRLQLTAQRLDRIRSTGEIRVVKGSYKTYGIELDITRGTLYYAGSPVNRPNLDIQAMRRVGDVRAGVIVSGTPKKLKTKLTSEPPMPDNQVISYIVLGQPLAYTREQSGLISRVSGQLLSAGGG
ncbi:MAG TPA: translocation/assembly module TamB domain-containing protein, partial [Desulfuromonadaceae bacterium]